MTSDTSFQSLLVAFRSCKSQAGLAALFGTSRRNLLFHLYSKAAPTYRIFTIPKASGTPRTISVPPPTVARWQRFLVPLLTNLYTPKFGTHGFVVGRSIRTNATRHVGRAFLLNIDIQDFFPSIHFGRVRGLFQRYPFNFNSEVAATLSQLCTNDKLLPQGAPTSPIISNLICRRLDTDLHRLAKKHRCTFTRFADDISLSTGLAGFSDAIVRSHSPYGTNVEIGDELLQIITKHQFSINNDKSRVQTAATRQEVTGVIVNRHVNVPRRYVRDLRAILRNWRTQGTEIADAQFRHFDAKQSHRRFGPPSVEAHVAGKLAYLSMIRGGGDRVYTKYAIAASKLTDGRLAPVLQFPATDLLDFLRAALWIVIGRDSTGDVGPQGTAFHLHGIGFVTARHVLDHDPLVKSWTIVRATPPHDEFPIVSYKSNPACDLAILGTAAKSHAMLRRNMEVAFKGEDVAVIGFPSWHSLADHPLRATMQVVQTKIISGIRLASVSYPLLSGSSGGPVLDSSGHVVGVIVRSKDDVTLPNAFIDISHIELAANAAAVAMPA
jgi:RNA-directed DNA polymerase